MIIVFALIGLITGWLLSIAADYLVRFAATKREPVMLIIQAPVLWRLVRGETRDAQLVMQLTAELFTAGLFALIYVLAGEALWLIAVSAFFVLISIMDFKYRLVLNVLMYPAIALALAINLVILRQPVLYILLGIAFAFGLFYVTALVRPNGLGGGDVKLAALIGAIFGFPQVLWALLVSAAASAIIIAGLLLSHRVTRKDSIPFAPFLCLGALLIIIYNSAAIG